MLSGHKVLIIYIYIYCKPILQVETKINKLILLTLDKFDTDDGWSFFFNILSLQAHCNHTFYFFLI